MNKYAELKRILKNSEVVQHYLGLPEKTTSGKLWYKSPFRRERTASFCVSDKLIYDFGDSTSYDMISFVAKYYNINNYKALQIICNDFGISLINEYENNKTINLLKAKRQEEAKIKEIINNWFYDEMQIICNEIKENESCIKIFENTTKFEVLNILYDKRVKLEYQFEIMVNAISNLDMKGKLYIKSREVRND